MKRFRARLVVGVLMLSLTASTYAHAADAPPKFLPTPPQQATAWLPPATTLSLAVVNATTTLFAQGMADPRGCEYRDITIRVGSVWDGVGPRRTHGWVLPATAPGKEAPASAFAVGWDGLVHPVLQVGAPADLAADVELVGDWKRQGDDGFERSYGHTVPVCLLLRLGRVDDAEKAGQGFAGRQEDPYLSLARSWVWSLSDRAVTAHMHGDDVLALEDARALADIGPMVDAEALRHDFVPRLEKSDGNGLRPFLDFLDYVPDLLAEQQRRAVGPRRATVLRTGIAHYPDKNARISALIEDLQEVAARQMGQPGGIGFNFDPVVLALVNEGDATVEPLLSCLETDRRLTRSVSFHRNFFPYRTLHPVYEAALDALEIILHTEFRNRYGGRDRKSAATQIRAYWAKYKDMPPAERWFSVLKDDEADPRQWQEAVNLIVERDNNAGRSAWGPRVPWSTDRSEKPRLRGEVLRAKTNPSVSELIVRRIEGVAKQDAYDSTDMALRLARWDAVAAAPVLRNEARRSIAASGGWPQDSTFAHVAEGIAALTMARRRAGDVDALAEYGAWLASLDSTRLGTRTAGKILEPLWRYPDDNALAAAARTIFDAPTAWWPRFMQPGEDAGLVATHLLSVPAFRERVLKELTNKTVVGTASAGAGAMVNGTLKGGGSFGSSRGLPPLAGAQGAVSQGAAAIPLRTCDYVAWNLAEIAGIPAFHPLWPEGQRDEAIGAIAVFLRRYGERFVYDPAVKHVSSWRDVRLAQLTFTGRKRPATHAEVRQGKAVFSLEGEGAARVVTLPKIPLNARWTVLTKYPYEVAQQDGAPRQEFLQDGRVWQEEELTAKGQKQVFYGYVGLHEMARVPAEEIEFLHDEGEWFWQRLDHGVDVRLSVPDDIAGEAPPPPAVNRPLPVDVVLFNRLGVAQEIAPYSRLLPDKSVALWRGVRVALEYSPTGSGSRNFREATVAPEPAWTAVPPKPRATSEDAGVVQRVIPGGSFTAWGMDLNEWFGLEQPGYYRLTVTFEGDGKLPGGATRPWEFQVAPAP